MGQQMPLTHRPASPSGLPDEQQILCFSAPPPSTCEALRWKWLPHRPTFTCRGQDSPSITLFRDCCLSLQGTVVPVAQGPGAGAWAGLGPLRLWLWAVPSVWLGSGRGLASP